MAKNSKAYPESKRIEDEINAKYDALNAENDAKFAAEMDRLNKARAAVDAVGSDIDAGHIRIDGTPRMESALATLNDAAQSIDISPVRAKFAHFENATLVDNLTAFETAAIVETAAMPIMRVTAIARIKNNAGAMRTVKGTIMPDGNGKTYGMTKSPLARFLGDTLNIRKQQISDYLAVSEQCLIGDVLKDVYQGYNFTQLSLLARSSNPDAAAQALQEHSSDSVADFRKALAAYETANVVVDGATVDGDLSSGQPDESTYPAFVYGILPRMNAENAFSVVTGPDDKAVVIRVPKVADAIDELRRRLNVDETMTFRLPKATYDELTRRLEKAFAPYKPIAAVTSMYNDGYLFPETFIIAQVVTQGTSVADETPKAAAKRIKTQSGILQKWLVGDLELANIPASSTLAASALVVYNDAKKRLEIPRMSAFDALKQSIEGITLEEAPKN